MSSRVPSPDFTFQYCYCFKMHHSKSGMSRFSSFLVLIQSLCLRLLLFLQYLRNFRFESVSLTARERDALTRLPYSESLFVDSLASLFVKSFEPLFGCQLLGELRQFKWEVLVFLVSLWKSFVLVTSALAHDR